MQKKALVVRLIHWSIVVLFTLSIFSGYRQADTGWPGTGIINRAIVNSAHETSGILIAILVVLWALARVRNILRQSAKSTWKQRSLAAYHLLFAALGGMISFLGWAGSSAGNYGQTLFGIIPVPNIIPELSAKEAVLLYGIHKDLIPIFLALLAIHISGTLFHVLILKDNTLRAMWFSHTQKDTQ